MHLYTSHSRQNPQETNYPQAVKVESLQDLLKVAANDHIFSQMKDNRRKAENFVQTDCLVLDLDNTHSEEPNDWKTIDDIADAFPDVHFYYVQSRNYMKPKKDSQGRIHEPREKYHLYFPLSKPITSRDKARKALQAAGAVADHVYKTKDLLDTYAEKPEQPMYGVEDPLGGEIAGEICLNDYLNQADVQEIWRQPKQTTPAGSENLDKERFVLPDIIGEGSRTGTLVQYVGSLWGRCPKLGEDEIKAIIRQINATQCTPPLSDSELEKTVFPAVHRFHASPAAKDFEEDMPEQVDVYTTPEEYAQDVVGSYVGEFMSTQANHPEPIPTGWRTLDKILGGGLYPGLYAIGAQSSFGKTTLVEQLAVRLSETGHDVLFFSIEMARYELIARGISRLTACLECGQNDYGSVAEAAGHLDAKGNKKLKYARTAVDLINPQVFMHLNHDEQDIVNKAAALYKERTGHMWVVEGMQSVPTILGRIREHKEHRGSYPVVVVDYLQIIDGPEQTDKMRVDNIVKRLRTEARGRFTVIVVSSLNRGSYYTEANQASFKESGGIEYSADVQIAIEPRDIGNGTTDSATASNKEVVKETTRQETWPVKLSILKNRLGRRDVSINFDYTAKYNIYEEVGETEKAPKVKKDKKSTPYAALIKEVQGMRADVVDALTIALAARTAGAPTPDLLPGIEHNNLLESIKDAVQLQNEQPPFMDPLEDF